MPFEQRDIIFYLSEISNIIDDHHSILKPYLKKKIGSDMLREVSHTNVIGSGTIIQRDRFQKVIDIPSNEPSSLFYGVRSGALKEKEFGFHIPDKVLMDILVTECISRKIRLPRKGKRKIVAENLQVALSIEMLCEDIVLEL